MWPFTLVVSFILLSASIIFLGFNRSLEFQDHLFATYNMLYGNFDEDDFTSPSQKALLVLVLFLLGVILLNLLISIIGESHDTFQGNKEFNGQKIQVDMILEFLSLSKTFKLTGTGRNGYLMTCGPRELANEANEEAEHTKAIRAVHERMAVLEEEMKKNTQAVEGKVKSVEDDIQKSHDEMMKLLKSLKTN